MRAAISLHKNVGNKRSRAAPEIAWSGSNAIRHMVPTKNETDNS